MKALGGWLVERPVRLHVLLAVLVSANAVVLFLAPWAASLALQVLSLLGALLLILTRRRAS